MNTNPDSKWYTRESERLGVALRCPFANVTRCPRFYQSIALLGEVGIMTKMPQRQDRRLTRKWERHFLWPAVAEEESSISGPPGEPKIFRHFCPEPVYEVFGCFADYLSDYAGELDRDLAAQRLHREGASSDDYRWQFSSVHPLHYTECPVYSQLLPQSAAEQNKPVVELKPNFYGIGIDLAEIWKRATKWFRRQ